MTAPAHGRRIILLTMDDVILKSRDVTLLEILDRVLDKGVVVSGDIVISVADVDLIYLGVRALLSSVETMECLRGTANERPRAERWRYKPAAAIGRTGESAVSCSENIRKNTIPKRIGIEPQNAENGLVKLVLTLVDLIRRLLEKQAMRRVEAGSLTNEEIERVGETLMRIEKKMQELKETFGFKDEDLNLNLGPLGDLM